MTRLHLGGFVIPRRNTAIVIPHRKAPTVIPNRNAAPVIPSRTPLLSFRAAGEESPPLATPGSLALLGMTSLHPGLVFAIPSFNAAIFIPNRSAALVIPSRTPLLSFRAAGEESPRLAMPRSLAFARDDDPGVIPSSRRGFSPLATPGSLALLGMTEPVSTRAKRTYGFRGVTRLRNSRSAQAARGRRDGTPRAGAAPLHCGGSATKHRNAVRTPMGALRFSVFSVSLW
jgi:hypothetical protein